MTHSSKMPHIDAPDDHFPRPALWLSVVIRAGPLVGRADQLDEHALDNGARRSPSRPDPDRLTARMRLLTSGDVPENWNRILSMCKSRWP